MKFPCLLSVDGAHGWLCMSVSILLLIAYISYIYIYECDEPQRDYLNQPTKCRPHIFNSKNYKWLVNGVCASVCTLHAQLESNWLDNKNRNLILSGRHRRCHVILSFCTIHNCTADWQLTNWQLNFKRHFYDLIHHKLNTNLKHCPKKEISCALPICYKHGQNDDDDASKT